jgi:ribokinase
MEIATAASLAAASRARAAGARTVLSLAPFRPLPADSFAPLSLLIVNETEAADLAAQLGLAAGDATETVRGLADRLGPTVVATLGPRGAVAATPAGETVAVPALPVTPVDTTGAGDTFAGVLGAALDAGLPLEPAMRRAAVAGSLACTKVGAQLSMPTAAEIDSALAGFAS